VNCSCVVKADHVTKFTAYYAGVGIGLSGWVFAVSICGDGLNFDSTEYALSPDPQVWVKLPLLFWSLCA